MIENNKAATKPVTPNAANRAVRVFRARRQQTAMLVHQRHAVHVEPGHRRGDEIAHRAHAARVQ